jgi:hypothetical protein
MYIFVPTVVRSGNEFSRSAAIPADSQGPACARMHLLRIDQYTPPGTDRRPLYQSVLEWLPRIQDPLTLTICLSRLLEPQARTFLQKHRELFLTLTREWNDKLREDDRELTLAALAQC